LSSSIGNYQVERWVRGYGREVCLATRRNGDVVEQRMLALFDLEDDRAQQLAREVEHCQGVDHPFLARVERMFDHEAWRVVVLEHFPGTSLHVLINHARRSEGTIGRLAAYHIGACLFSALAAAHAAREPTGRVIPLVHGNLGPAQVLLAWDGSVKLVGLGLATMYQLSSVLDEQPSAAIPYQPPEYKRGGALTVRGNVFSAAALLWTLLSGRAFPAGDLPAPRIDTIRKDIASPVVNVLERALVASLLERRSTASDLARIFAHAIDEQHFDGSDALAGHLETLRLSVVDDDVLAPPKRSPHHACPRCRRSHSPPFCRFRRRPISSTSSVTSPHEPHCPRSYRTSSSGRSTTPRSTSPTSRSPRSPPRR
jgi:eukaryotic-like serine/threonine-protein kinase